MAPNTPRLSMARLAGWLRACIWRVLARCIFAVADALIWVGEKCARRASRAEPG